jgi:hypothetical protein
VDAGGDITGQGDEPELLSPLADSCGQAGAPLRNGRCGKLAV